MIFDGLPLANLPSGILSFITEPADITQSLPMITPGKIRDLEAKTESCTEP